MEEKKRQTKDVHAPQRRDSYPFLGVQLTQVNIALIAQ